MCLVGSKEGKGAGKRCLFARPTAQTVPPPLQRASPRCGPAPTINHPPACCGRGPCRRMRLRCPPAPPPAARRGAAAPPPPGGARGERKSWRWQTGRLKRASRYLSLSNQLFHGAQKSSTLFPHPHPHLSIQVGQNQSAQGRVAWRRAGAQGRRALKGRQTPKQQPGGSALPHCHFITAAKRVRHRPAPDRASPESPRICPVSLITSLQPATRVGRWQRWEQARRRAGQGRAQQGHGCTASGEEAGRLGSSAPATKTAPARTRVLTAACL